jgi:hypothetical protein
MQRCVPYIADQFDQMALAQQYAATWQVAPQRRAAMPLRRQQM